MTDSASSQQLATMTGHLPVFHGSQGEGICQWLCLFELTRRSKGLNDDLSRLLLLCSLDGEAKNFYSYIGGDNLSIQEIIAKMETRFDIARNIPQAQELIDGLTKMPSETWVGFVERFTVLARRCGLPETFQVAWILKRIPQNLQSMLDTLRLASVDIIVDGIIAAL